DRRCLHGRRCGTLAHSHCAPVPCEVAAMPNTRYTVRLPPALDALVQERILTTRTPFTILVREALSAYLADSPPPGPPTPADSADTLRELQAQLAAVTARVEILELAL